MRRALTLAALSCPTLAAAQDPPPDPARLELIAQAEVASAAGDHPRALELAQRAAALRSTPSLMVFLAREHRALSRWVDALDHARACLRAAEADLGLRNRATILQACESVRARVEPLVARLELQVSDPPPGLTVRVGSRELPGALLGVAVPLMPGEVRVEATAPGRETFSETLTLSEGELRRVELRLPILSPPLALPPAPAPPPPSLPLRRVAVPSSRAVGAGPWVLGGAGVMALALGGVFFGLASSAQGERDAACDAAGCAPSAREADSRYGDMLAWSSGAWVAGGALLGGALVWFFVERFAPRRRALAASSSLTGLALSF